MTNPRSASNAWANIKKKIMVKGVGAKTKGDDGEANNAIPKPKVSTRKRGKAAADGDDDESPTKKAKNGKKGKGGKKAGSEDDDAQVQSPVKTEPTGQDKDGLGF